MRSISRASRLEELNLISDIYLKTSDSTVPGNTASLLAVFPAFADALYNGNINEFVVVFGSFRASVIEQIVLFAYAGEIEITVCNVFDIFSVAKILESHCLVEYCLSFIAKRISHENIATIWQFAKDKAVADLRTACLTIAKCHPGELINTQGGQIFLQCLSKEDFLEVLSNPKLRVTEEEDRFRLVVSWLSTKSDGDIRETIEQLFGYLNPLRLSNATDFLEVEMNNHPLITKNVSVRDLIREARMLATIPGLAASGQITTFNTEVKTRCFPKEDHFISVTVTYGNVNGVQIVDLKSQEVVATINANATFCPNVCFAEGKIYVFGTVFEISTESCSQGIDDEDAHANTGGTERSVESEKEVEALSVDDPPISQMAEASNVQGSDRSCCTESNNGDPGGAETPAKSESDMKALAVGDNGNLSERSGASSCDNTYWEHPGVVIDVKTREFRILSKRKSNNISPGPIEIKGKVLFTMSYNRETRENMLIFDPKTEKFHESQLPCCSVSNAGVLVINNTFIITIGGEGENSDCNDVAAVFYLDPSDAWLREDCLGTAADRPTWKSMPPLLQARRDPAVAFLYGMIFVASGTCSNNHIDSVEVFKSIRPTAFVSESDWLPEGQWTRLENLKFLSTSYHDPVMTSGHLGLSIIEAFETENGDRKSRVFFTDTMGSSDSGEKEVEDPQIDPLRLSEGQPFPDFREDTWKWNPIESFVLENYSDGIAFFKL